MELTLFNRQDAVRNNILERMNSLITRNNYQLNENNLSLNPILSLFDEKTLEIVGGFETRWMPDHILEKFLVEKTRIEDYEVVLIRALPDSKSYMHIHEQGASLITTLGESYGFPAPTTELLFGNYVPQRAIQEVRRVQLTDNGYTLIAPYTIHAFHTPANGTAYALAVASPRIKKFEENFDFVVLGDHEWKEK